jgi:hypothetical protein
MYGHLETDLAFTLRYKPSNKWDVVITCAKFVLISTGGIGTATHYELWCLYGGFAPVRLNLQY